MFTGIIQALGKIARVDSEQNTARVVISSATLGLEDVVLGDSIAVSGPCLTVVDKAQHEFTVDVSSETLARTTLGQKQSGAPVNLEKALRLSDRLGGHLVSGHVDGLGSVVARANLQDYVQFRIDAPSDLARYIAPKGSIAVDGVSLTVNAVRGDEFELMIIPHTLQETTLGDLAEGDQVNLEIDLLARYLERLADYSSANTSTQLTVEQLSDAGFIRE